MKLASYLFETEINMSGVELCFVMRINWYSTMKKDLSIIDHQGSAAIIVVA